MCAAQSRLIAAMSARDRAACDPLLSSDCTVVRATKSNTVEVLLRAGWLDEIGRGATSELTITDQVVSAYGDLAVATVYWLEPVDAAEPQHGGATDLWRKDTGGQWVLAERHAH